MYKLPKWPQMILTGKRLNTEQAKEVIFRTDYTFTDGCPYAFGSDRAFYRKYQKASGLSELCVPRTNRAGRTFTEVDWEAQSDLRERLGVVLTNYVSNAWGNGYVGWCHPDGTLRHDGNIGKWPSTEEVMADCQDLAQSFPFLDFNITLMSGECCEDDTYPVCNVKVCSGQATLLPPDLTVHDPLPKYEFKDHLYLGECASPIPTHWWGEFAQRVSQVI